MSALLAPGDPLAGPAQAAAAQCPAVPTVPGDQFLLTPHPPPPSLATGCRLPLRLQVVLLYHSAEPTVRALALLSPVAELGILMLDGAKQRDPMRPPEGTGCWHRAGRSGLTGAQEG